jgi:hypothetical protein
MFFFNFLEPYNRLFAWKLIDLTMFSICILFDILKLSQWG